MKQSKLVRTKRLVILLGTAGALIIFIFMSFNRYMMYFVTPSDLLKDKDITKKVRLGGVVVPGSFNKKNFKSLFKMTDGEVEMSVHYEGILPNLFREGQTIIAEGHYDPSNKYFKANLILAKHDQRYMPKVVKDKLDKSKVLER